jgi:L-fuconolactonase
VSVSEGVTGTIVVEASERIEDNQWILDLAAKDPFIVGFSGNLQPGSPDFVRNLDRFAANPLFRGIRPRGAKIKDQNDPGFFRDLERLAEKDLELDLLIVPDGLPAAAAVAGRVPSLRIVINHVANVHITGKAPDPKWIVGMERAAEHPNVYVKVSGLASATRQIPAPTDVAFYAPTLDVLWKAFGEDRLIYGSDWPVCSRFAEYPTVLRVVKTYFGVRGETAVEKYFWKNAKAAYKWLTR